MTVQGTVARAVRDRRISPRARIVVYAVATRDHGDDLVAPGLEWRNALIAAMAREADNMIARHPEAVRLAEQFGYLRQTANGWALIDHAQGQASP